MKKYQFELFMKKVGKKLLLLVAILAGLYVLTQIIAMISTLGHDGDIVFPKNDQLKEIYNSNVFGDTAINDKNVNKYLEVIDSFIKYCNVKDYGNAYNLLNPAYKELLMPTIDEFKQYVDDEFDKQKAYSYQNLTNLDNYYVYEITIYDDVMVYGANSYNFNANKAYLTLKDDGKSIYISLDGFIERVNIDREVKGEILNLVVMYKDVYYDKVDIKVKYTNNTSDILVINRDDVKYSFLNISKVHDYSTHDYSLSATNSILTSNEPREVSYSYQVYYNIPEYIEYAFSLNRITLYDKKYVTQIITNPYEINITPKTEYTRFVVEL